MLFGLHLLITGVIRIVVGTIDASIEGWEKALTITLGVLLLIAGVFCLRNPALSLLTLVVVIAIGWLVDGVINIAIGAQNPRGERAGRIVLGVVFLIGGIEVLAWWPAALLTFALVGGWILIAFGITAAAAGVTGWRSLNRTA